MTKKIISEPVTIVAKKTRRPRKPKNMVSPIVVEKPVPPVPPVEPVSVEPVSVVEEPKTVVVKKERKPNKWIRHCKEVQSKNQGLSYRDVLKLAKETYSKSE